MTQILVFNGGSSSIRFAWFDGSRATLRGKLERLGTPGARLTVDGGSSEPPHVPQNSSPADFLLDWLTRQPGYGEPQAVGHRIVHGMQHTEPERITPRFIEELKRLIPFDREHLPREIELIEQLHRRKPGLPQVACFDTRFHRDLPRTATLLPIPRRYADRGIRRYGFHGISFTYLLQELARSGDRAAAHGKVILAHLGSGASLAAVRDGRCIDTSMGFTPTAGLVMGTRSGDLDPGLMSYLVATESMSAERFSQLVNHESGLLGISGSSADVRDLLEREGRDEHAAEALDVFCYQARKWIGAFAAALGGLDTLVFAGGIGENAAPVRERICRDLGFLGIRLDADANAEHAAVISRADAGTAVRVIRTDEESVIAALTESVLNSSSPKEHP